MVLMFGCCVSNFDGNFIGIFGKFSILFIFWFGSKLVVMVLFIRKLRVFLLCFSKCW